MTLPAASRIRFDFVTQHSRDDGCGVFVLQMLTGKAFDSIAGMIDWGALQNHYTTWKELRGVLSQLGWPTGAARWVGATSKVSHWFTSSPTISCFTMPKTMSSMTRPNLPVRILTAIAFPSAILQCSRLTLSDPAPRPIYPVPFHLPYPFGPPGPAGIPPCPPPTPARSAAPNTAA